MTATKDVKETISNWLRSEEYPDAFSRFFTLWTLLNLYYNQSSQKDHELDRVLDFGRQNEKLFPFLKELTARMIVTECVGNGKEIQPPNSFVKTATLHLRGVLGIDTKPICENCRQAKRQHCEKIACETYVYGNMEAVARILYQIRCNLFHGDKTEYLDGFQAQRNRFLVKIGSEIVKQILSSISSDSLP